MENFEKKSNPDFSRENEYAREEIRIAEILKTKMSEDEASKLVLELEKLAKENDEIVSKILRHPNVVDRYATEDYDGLGLHPKPPVEFPIHYIKDGLWKLRHLDKTNIFATHFIDSKEYNSEKLLKWFSEEGDFNKLRLKQLEEKGDLVIRDPSKVRIKAVESRDKKDDKKEIIH